MPRRDFQQHASWVFALICFVLTIVAWALFSGEASRSDVASASRAALRKPTGSPPLISVEPLPVAEGKMCEWIPASSQERFIAFVRQERMAVRSSAASAADERLTEALDRPPVRVIRDPFPIYSAVAVDLVNNEIVLQDENLFQIMVYDRQANTPPTATMTEPKRVIGGHHTKVEFNCGLYIDPKTGDIYSVNNDTIDTLTIFSRNARGDVPPDRELRTPHGTYGIAVDEGAQELYLTVQHGNAVVVYRKAAQGEEKPIRTLKGAQSQLADPHGIALDTKNNWMFVANYGNAKNGEIPGSGTFVPPSITVYPIKASGNTPPLRTIEGPNTKLNWPAHIYVDSENGELYVANDADDSILIFRSTDSGDVAPQRVLKGPKTGIKNPTGVFVDTVNNELVIANMGNHSATIYPRSANGNVAPLRTIRGGPQGNPALQIGNPGAVAYDTKRNEILVPN